MSQETDRLSREAEEHRSSLDQTIERLKGRMSVGQIVDELSGYVREGQGADMVNNLGRQVRDNPLALGLIGAGAAWLLLGQGVRGQAQDTSHKLRDRYEDWRHGDDPDDVYAESTGTMPRRAVGRYSGGSDYQSDMAHDMPYGATHPGNGARSMPDYAGGGSTGPGVMSKASSSAKSAASSAAGSVSDTASGVSNAVSNAAGQVSDAASSVAGKVSGAASSAAGSISDGASHLSDSASRYGHDARDAAYRAGSASYRQASYYGRRARRSFLDTLQEEPLILGAVAVAIGAAIGAALPSTRTEDEMMGDARDRIRDQAYDYGKDAVHKAENVATKAYEAGSAEAENKGLKPSGESGETLAEKVSSVAKAATDTAKDEARKEGLA